MCYTIEQTVPMALSIRSLRQTQSVSNLPLAYNQRNRCDLRSMQIECTKRFLDQIFEETLNMAAQQNQRTAQESRIRAGCGTVSMRLRFR